MLPTIWTKEEVRNYHPLENKSLSDLYFNVRIPNTNPEERAKYLVEKVLSLTNDEHYVIMLKAKKDGRDAALNSLEDKAIEKIEQSNMQSAKSNGALKSFIESIKYFF